MLLSCTIFKEDIALCLCRWVFGLSGAAHWARSAASAPDSLTAVCPEEKRRGGRGGSILLQVSYLMMSYSSEGQHLSANKISSTYQSTAEI